VGNVDWRRPAFVLLSGIQSGRLERGTFTFPAGVTEGVTSVAIDVHELAVLLEGIEVDVLKTKQGGSRRGRRRHVSSPPAHLTAGYFHTTRASGRPIEWAGRVWSHRHGFVGSSPN
jgi:hypothetical protein